MHVNPPYARETSARARSLSLSLLFLPDFAGSRRVASTSHTRRHPPLRLAFTDAPFFPPMRPLRSRLIVIFQFPSPALSPLCLFLDTVERLNATTNPLRFFSLSLSLPLSLSFCLPHEIWYAVTAWYSARDATVEERNRSSAFASLLSTRCILCTCARAVFANKGIRSRWNVKTVDYYRKLREAWRTCSTWPLLHNRWHSANRVASGDLSYNQCV